jgi:hypothetical protein
MARGFSIELHFTFILMMMPCISHRIFTTLYPSVIGSKKPPMQFPMLTGLFLLTAPLSELISTPQARRKKGEPYFQNEALGRSRGD